VKENKLQRVPYPSSDRIRTPASRGFLATGHSGTAQEHPSGHLRRLITQPAADSVWQRSTRHGSQTEWRHGSRWIGVLARQVRHVRLLKRESMPDVLALCHILLAHSFVFSGWQYFSAACASSLPKRDTKSSIEFTNDDRKAPTRSEVLPRANWWPFRCSVMKFVHLSPLMTSSHRHSVL